MMHISDTFSLGLFKDSYKCELLSILDSAEGPKSIYWEKSLLNPTNAIVGYSVLQEHGVSYSFLINAQNIAQSPPNSKSIFFIIPPDLKVVDIIRNFLKLDASDKLCTSKKYYIIAIPSFSIVCKSFLQEMRAYENIAAIYELPLTLVPIDSDILSMENALCFSELSLKEKEACLFDFARGLMKFQSIYGTFPRIRAKGPKAKRVVAMLTQMLKENATTISLDDSNEEVQILNSTGQLNLLIIIDRSVDMLTPCLSQLTYGGLISEVWSPKYGTANISFGSDESREEPKRIAFNSADQFFCEIRDKNIADVGFFLSKRAKELSTIVNETRTSKELSTLQRVANQLPELRQLHEAVAIHTRITEVLQEFTLGDEFMSNLKVEQDFLSAIETDKAHPYVEQRILEMAPLEEVLRLICIQSFCNGGLKQRLLDYYKREILQVYGFEHMLTLDNLEKVGLLEEASNVSTALQPDLMIDHAMAHSCDIKKTVCATSALYAGTLRRNLRLQVTSDSASLDGALAHLTAGYIPITVRLVQAMALNWHTNSPSGPGSLSQSAFSAASNIASTALQAGKRFVIGGFSGQQQGIANSLGYTDSVTNLVPGPEVNEVQMTRGMSSLSKDDLARHSTQANQTLSKDFKCIMVAFVGGVTLSEIAALRLVAASDERNINFVFATTGLLTWQNLIGSLSETISVAELTS